MSTASSTVSSAQANVRAFYTLIATQVVSQIGSRMSALALSIWLFSQTGDVTPLALTALFQFLPQVIGASMAGVIADRYDRRLVMVAADAGQALGTLFLLLVVATGTFEVWHLYVVSFVQSLFGMFQSPAFTASVTTMIPDGQRDRANAIMQLIGPLAGVIAPAIAGSLYALVGLTGVIAIDLGTFLIAVIVVLMMRIPRPERSAEGKAAEGSVIREALAGFAYLWKMRPMFWMTLHISLVNFLFSGAMVMATPYLLGRTGSEATLGLLLGVLNVGAIVGGVAMGAIGGKFVGRRVPLMLGGIIFAAFALVFVGLGQAAVVLGAALFMLMLPIPMINAAAMSLLQVKTPPDLQGRVFAALGQLATVLIPVSYLISGPLADNVFEPAVGTPAWEAFAPFLGNTSGSGMALIMVIAGVILIVSTAAALSVRSIREMERNIPDYQAPEAVSDAPESPVETGTMGAVAAV